jgi:protein-tyrosine-phosphatase
MNGFDDFDTQVSAEEFYSGWTEDEADYMDQLCTMCRTHDQAKAEEVQQEDAVSYSWEYEDHMAQWDNDPSPYDGTYSEE